MRHLLAALIVALMLGALLTRAAGAQVSLTTLGCSVHAELRHAARERVGDLDQ